MADRVLTWTRSKQNEIVAFLRELVECESPSDDPAAITRFTDLFRERVRDLGNVEVIPTNLAYGPHLQCEINLPGEGTEGRILALGHSDTVYPLGTLSSMPWRQHDGRLWGPGVLDMKAGIAFFVFAMRAIRELDIPVRRKVLLQLNSDEEIGSESSRPLTEDEARKSVAVLVLEPGTGLDGKAKTARKGVGDYIVTVRGKEAHAGLDFASGASAILELARQIENISHFTDLDTGLNVNPGVIKGGTRSNVIAGFAQMEVDFRVSRLADATVLEDRFRKLEPVDRRCTIDIAGGLNRPPMERTREIGQLFATAQKLAAELGIDLQESTSGGGSDGNFTAALGIPTLDGIGAIGEGAHSRGESILIDRIADRTALLAKLVAAI